MISQILKGYKSSFERLSKLFKKSRDQWKQKAAERQAKLRAQAIRIRDLEKSRDEWKKRAKAAQEQLKELEKQKQADGAQAAQVPEREFWINQFPEKADWLAPKGHHYPVALMQMGISQIIETCNSLRGIIKGFALWSQHLAIPVPSYTVLRQWVLRFGLYQLQRPRDKKTEWIFIIDFVVEGGTEKCLVVLGLAQAHWQKLVEEHQGQLTYQDVEVLAVEAINKPSGKVIQPVLERVTQQVGEPVQIISDHGPDVKKGVELYLQEHPNVLYTYDVSHQAACLLKAELGNDEQYQSFNRQCNRSRQQLQQTELLFLMPPNQRVKARFMNVEPLISWAQKVLAYEHRGDFSQINAGFCWDEMALTVVSGVLDPSILSPLAALKNQSYPNREAFVAALKACLSPSQFEEGWRRFCGRRIWEDDVFRRSWGG